jgi:RNA polymerase sigma-70 factor (ECF subfamily)
VNAVTIASPESLKTEFRRIVERHQSRVYSIACRILQDPATAEEVAQDVFLALHGSLGRIENEEHLLRWLRRVTVQRATDAHRRRAARTSFAEVALEEESLPPSRMTDWPQPSVANFDQDGPIGTLLRSLPAEQRTIVVLRYQEDMTPTEIAETLSMSINTVKSHLQRSLKQLRSRLERVRGEGRHA